MLKKIALLVVMFALPLGAMAQAKFAHMNSHMAQRQEQFQQEAYQSMQKAQQDAMAPIYQKLDEAIQAVGKAEGVVYIFDLARTPIPFVGAQSVDVTAKVKTQLGIK